MLIFQALLRWRSPAVLIEVLVYPGFRWAAEGLRAEVVRVAMDKDGIIPEVRPAAARARDSIDICVQRAVNILGGYDLAWPAMYLFCGCVCHGAGGLGPL